MINEKELKKYLLNLEFPIKIDEVFKNIDNILFYSTNEYPNFALEVFKKKKNNKYEITDKIILNYGKLKEFSITKNGKTISIKDDDSWTYDSKNISAYTDKNGKVGFSAKEMKKDELNKLKTIKEEMNLVDKDIEKIKKLSNTLQK